MPDPCQCVDKHFMTFPRNQRCNTQQMHRAVRRTVRQRRRVRARFDDYDSIGADAVAYQPVGCRPARHNHGPGNSERSSFAGFELPSQFTVNPGLIRQWVMNQRDEP
jgi:hypothetical protein